MIIRHYSEYPKAVICVREQKLFGGKIIIPKGTVFRCSYFQLNNNWIRFTGILNGNPYWVEFPMSDDKIWADYEELGSNRKRKLIELEKYDHSKP